MECLYARSLIDEGHWYEGLARLEKSLEGICKKKMKTEVKGRKP